ncbi:MAG: CehA/McbA family metallohydrolase [bacterium]
MSLVDYGGCLHIHSRHSDGTGTVPEIMAAARDSGIDFIILTDHNRWFPEYQGWHDNLMVITGAELGHRSSGHVLAFPLASSSRVPKSSDLELLEFVKREGAAGFIAHPFTPAKPWFGIGSRIWREWDTDLYDGIELWTYMYDWIEEVGYRNLAGSLKSPEELISGPFSRTLEKWDELTRKRPVVAIGGLDAHAKIGAGSLSLKLPSYGYLFKTLRTRVLLEKPFTGEYRDDSKELCRAVARGHCYLGYDLLASSAGFRWQAQTEKESFIMGDLVPSSARRLQLEAVLPREGELVLIRNGREIKRKIDSRLKWETNRRGVYRVEVYLNGAPWIFSNPVYWY